MKRWIGITLAGLVGVLLLALVGGYVYMLPVFKVATGYTAKVICSNHYLTGQSLEAAMADLPDNPLVPFLRIEQEEDGLSATLWGWAAKQRAIYRPGLGCTLLAGQGPFETQTIDFPPPPQRDLSQPWPVGEAVDIQPLPELEAVLDEAFSDPDPSNPRRTRAIVIVKDGRIIAERYAEGYDKDTPFLGWSMTKSVLHALLGVVVMEGKLDIMAPAPVPEWASADDPRHGITPDQLMRMSSGLAFNEDYDDLRTGVTQMLYNTSDMAAYAAQMPLAAPPDTVWNYSSGTANILSRMIRDVLGGSLADYWMFPRKALFYRIGMTSAVLEPDASGTFVGSSYMYATARDWARFGQLYLDDGVWQGERILPEGWVDYARTPTPPSQGQYGALWWLNRGQGKHREWEGVPEDAYAAEGHDGQYVVVIPSRGLVVVRLGVSRHGAWDEAAFLRSVLDVLE